jgi:hypothetical protein
MASGGAVFAGAPEGGTLAGVSTATPAAGTIDSNEWLTWTSGVAAGFLADVFITRLPVVAIGFSVAEGATGTEATGATAGEVWSAVSAGSTAGSWGFANGIDGSSATGFTTGGEDGGGTLPASCARAAPAAAVKRIAARNERQMIRMTFSFAE